MVINRTEHTLLRGAEKVAHTPLELPHFTFATSLHHIKADSEGAKVSSSSSKTEPMPRLSGSQDSMMIVFSTDCTPFQVFCPSE